MEAGFRMGEPFPRLQKRGLIEADHGAMLRP